MAVVGRWRLHPLHLDLVRSYLGLEDLTLPLEGPSYCATLEQLGEVGRREQPTMEHLDIIVNDEVATDLAEALEVLAKPYLWVDSLWFPEFGGDAAWRTVAAVTEGDRVVLGVQEPGEDHYGGALTVETHENVPLPQVLLLTLPSAPPGNRGTARVPVSLLREVSDEPHRPRSSSDHQVALYRSIGEAAHVRGGQLAANLRDRHGRVHRSQVIRWFDNVEPDGRYLNLADRSPTGEQTVVITAADARVMTSAVNTLLKSVR